MDYDQEDFADYMRHNTTLSEGSIKVYSVTISTFLKVYPEVTLKAVKEFISQKNREHNDMQVRAPWRHFFRYKGMDEQKVEELYRQLPHCRRMPIKRPGTFLPDKILQSLIMAIDNPIYKAVSILRYHTGIRAFEALTLKEEMITEEELTIQTDKGPKQAQFTKMIIETKRGRNRPIYLKRSLAEAILGQYMTGMPGYLFMPRHYDIYDRRDIAIKLRTAISLYNDALAQAAKKIGLKQRFGTHDIRRAFAMRTKRQLKDLELVRRLMGHSKIDTTLRYFSQSNEDLIDAIAKMQRLT